MTVRSAFLASVALYAGSLLWAAATLPARVPVHWGGDGVDRVVSKGRALLELGLGGAGLAVLLGGAAAAVARVPLSLVNVPHKEFWARPENRPDLNRRLAADLWLIAAATMVLLTVGVVQVGLVAEDPDPRLGPLFWVAVAAYLVLVLGYALHCTLRRYRPDGPPDLRSGEPA